MTDKPNPTPQDEARSVKTTDLPLEFLEKMDAFKRKKILDLIRRVIANPQNAEEVANAIALDWFPRFQVDEKGKIDWVHNV